MSRSHPAGSYKNPRRTVQPADYQAYIQSAAWRAVRKRYWDSLLPKFCYGCEMPWLVFKQGMHLHHRTYRNLGNERLMDLFPLCQSCHSQTHGRAWEHGCGLWGAAKRIRAANGLTGRLWQSHMDSRTKLTRQDTHYIAPRPPNPHLPDPARQNGPVRIIRQGVVRSAAF